MLKKKNPHPLFVIGEPTGTAGCRSAWDRFMGETQPRTLALWAGVLEGQLEPLLLSALPEPSSRDRWRTDRQFVSLATPRHGP